ncbi:hypothetical protein H5V45_15095 [Nocardioides sp. KIGAM211]|uniref:Endonuclease/exonuclease/phosphatase domain-containing protein n=1 Tax=Nocardioides luti TaxID=2761101 RepID=A0A7X0VBP9_9ACTN|nr:endonuclease/exonuclease/phosphatase family protein [Nocardioides luti]MBB6628650.1 hypothetical protein [Nocardioides luti]
MTLSRALSPLALLLTLAVGSTLPAAAAPVAASAPHAGQQATAHRGAAADLIDIGSYNIRADRSTKKFSRAVATFRKHVDVAGLQEVNTGHKTKALMRMKGWESYRPASLQQNPVIWRDDVFDQVAARGAKIATARSIGKEGVPHYRKAQIATVVRLQHLATGRTLSVINVHLVTGGVNGGKCIKAHPKLCALYADSVAGLADVVAEEQDWADDEVYVFGDFNDHYPADEKFHKKQFAYATLTKLGMVAHYELRPEQLPNQGSGTRSGAYLDQIWGRQVPVAEKVWRSIKASDHYPITATYPILPPVPTP